jgi:hypothetical protein
MSTDRQRVRGNGEHAKQRFAAIRSWCSPARILLDDRRRDCGHLRQKLRDPNDGR